MKVEIKVPPLGESITEATVGNILKPSGSYVNSDEEVLELETEKVNQILYSPAAGVLSLDVSTDSVVKIGQVLGSVDTEAQGKVAEAKEPAAKQTKEKAEPKEEKKQTTPIPKEQKAMPEVNARWSTEEYIEELKNPQIAKQTAIPAQDESQQGVKIGSPLEIQSNREPQRDNASTDKKETRRRMTMIRKVIANRMVEAKQTTAMLTTFNEVDMSQIISIREKNKEMFQKKYGTKLGFMSFFVKASVSALQSYPEINSYIDGQEIVQREYYDIGVAVGTDRGLIVPVIRGCDHLSFAEIEKSIEQFAKKAREDSISVDDLRGGGFTITNGGVYGSLLSTPILNPPQSGILGMHKIEKRAVVINDEIVIRPMMYVALSYDHRIVDGKEAVGFLVQVKQFLEDPLQLIF